MNIPKRAPKRLGMMKTAKDIAAKVTSSAALVNVGIGLFVLIVVAMLFFYIRNKRNMMKLGGSKKDDSKDVLDKAADKEQRKDMRNAGRVERKQDKKFLGNPEKFYPDGSKRTRSERKAIADYRKVNNGAYPPEIQAQIDAAKA